MDPLSLSQSGNLQCVSNCDVSADEHVDIEGNE